MVAMFTMVNLIYMVLTKMGTAGGTMVGDGGVSRCGAVLAPIIVGSPSPFSSVAGTGGGRLVSVSI